MKKLIRPRGTHKTAQLIRMSADKDQWPTYIVCASLSEAGEIHEQAKNMGLDIPLPITFDELLRGEFARGTRIKGFVIDNVDRLLQELGRGVPIQAITMTEED